MIRRLLCRLGLLCRYRVVPFERGIDLRICRECGEYQLQKRCK